MEAKTYFKGLQYQNFRLLLYGIHVVIILCQYACLLSNAATTEGNEHQKSSLQNDNCNQETNLDQFKESAKTGAYEIIISHPALNTKLGYIPDAVYQGMYVL